MTRRIITVTGADRPGLVAAISEILASEGADLEDVSMTRLSGNFATILLARGGDAARIQKRLDEAAVSLDLHIHLEDAVEESGEQEPNAYVSAVGPNRTGIVAEISRILAKHGVNITEMATRLLHRTEVPVYLVRIEAIVNDGWETLEKELLQAGKNLGIEVRLEPLERTDL